MKLTQKHLIELLEIYDEVEVSISFTNPKTNKIEIVLSGWIQTKTEAKILFALQHPTHKIEISS